MKMKCEVQNRERSHTILHVDIDSFFASVEQVLNPDLRGKPVCVGGTADDRSVVASASYEAKARGVKTAMTIAEARRVCPDGVFLRGHYPHYKDASDKMLDVLSSFSPDIEKVSLDDVYVDLTGFDRLYGHPLPVAEQMKERIQKATGVNVSIGIGTNKLIAKMASVFAKPNGVALIWPNYERSFIAPMPVGELPGVGRRTRQMLDQFNIHTIAELSEIDERLMSAAFGANGAALAHRARGIDEAAVEDRSLPKSISRETTFEQDTADRGTIDAMIHYLVERACKRLRELRAQAKCLTLKIRYTDFETYTRARSLPTYADRDDEFYELAQELFERLFTRRLRVRLVGVSLSNLSPTRRRQTELFVDRRTERRGQLYESLDQIRSKFGFCSIVAGPSIRLLNEMEHDFHGFKLRTACLTQ